MIHCFKDHAVVAAMEGLLIHKHHLVRDGILLGLAWAGRGLEVDVALARVEAHSAVGILFNHL